MGTKWIVIGVGLAQSSRPRHRNKGQLAYRGKVARPRRSQIMGLQGNEKNFQIQWYMFRMGWWALAAWVSWVAKRGNSKMQELFCAALYSVLVGWGEEGLPLLWPFLSLISRPTTSVPNWERNFRPDKTFSFSGEGTDVWNKANTVHSIWPCPMYKGMFVSSYKRKQHDKHFMRQGYHIKTRISAGDNKDLRAGIAS